MNSMDRLYSFRNSLTSSSDPSPPSVSLPLLSAAFFDRPNSIPKAVLPMISMAIRSESWQKGMQSWSGHPAMLSASASTYDCIVGMSPASRAGWYRGTTMFLIADHVESLASRAHYGDLTVSQSKILASFRQQTKHSDLCLPTFSVNQTTIAIHSASTNQWHLVRKRASWCREPTVGGGVLRLRMYLNFLIPTSLHSSALATITSGCLPM
jgi:hypothetical protein